MHHQRHSSGGHTLIIAREPPLHSRMSMQDSSRGRGNGAGMAPNFLVYSMPIYYSFYHSHLHSAMAKYQNTSSENLKLTASHKK